MSGSDGDPDDLRGWRPVAPVGRGATAELWRVERDGRAGVLKRPVPDQRRNPVFRALVAIEAEALCRVRHDGVIRLLDAGDGWVVVEPAETSAAAAPPRDWAGCRALLDRVAGALAASHAAGVVHRDVKAENVLRTGRGWVLADFGAARIDGVPDPAPALGSPEAMAPERLAGQPASPASDWFSLGVLAYRLVCGRAPFPTRWDAVLRAHARGTPPIVPAIPVPGAVGPWIGALLAPDPAARPADPPPR